MRVKDVVREDCVNYKKISMFIAAPTCSGKCWVERGLPADTCQNFALYHQNDIVFTNTQLVEMFVENELEDAVVFGGLEPFEMFGDLLSFIHDFRNKYKLDNDIVIYTGYEEDELAPYIKMLSLYKNIIVKFGRFVPDDSKVYDELLGVTLSSSNQKSRFVSM